jgi:hypothetical protein
VKTQKSEIYFTNHTLTGKQNAFPWLGFGYCHEVPRAVRCLPSLFHQLHFDWDPGGLFVLGVRRRRAARRPCCQYRRSARGTCRLYFTNHTLTGKQNAFPFQGSESGLSVRVGLLVKLFFARCLPSLFHQSHFDWNRESLSAFDSRSRPRCHLSVAAPSPNFFHRSHFDWEPDVFPLQRLDTAKRFRRPSCRQRPHSDRARHLYFTNRTLAGSRVLRLPNGALLGLAAQESPSSRGFLTAKRFRTTKCPL